MLSKTLSPLDGRYAKELEKLRTYFSEEGLVRARIFVECEYLLFLSASTTTHLRKFTDDEVSLLRSLQDAPDIDRVKEIEETTKHDVKAVEYFMKEKLKDTSLSDVSEWIHFALTSEDTNNLSHAVLLETALRDVILPALNIIENEIHTLAKLHANTPMLARTHGQPASPTTVGKEFLVFYKRLARQVEMLTSFTLSVKLNGATGNYNAHISAYPAGDWISFSNQFVAKLNATHGFHFILNAVTTQIEPHDTYAELFDTMRRVNVILIDFCQDMWRYISDGWIIQKAKEGEVGSSFPALFPRLLPEAFTPGHP